MKNCRDSSFSLRGLEAKLPAFRLQMLATRDVTELWSPRIATIYSDCDPLWLLQTKLLASAGWKRAVSLSATDVRNMWRHVCFRNPFPPFLFGFPSIQSLRCSCRKKNSFMQRSRGFGHRVVAYKICYGQYSDCVQDLDCRFFIVLSGVTCDCCKPMKGCRDWAFSNSGLEVGLPAFQLPMFSKCDALPKGDLFDMFVQGIYSHYIYILSEFPITHSLPEAGSWEEQYVPPVLQYYGCIMPFCKKRLFSCREAEGLVTELWSPRFVIQWLCPRFGLQDIDCALICDMWRLQTHEQLSRLSF